MPGAKGGEAEDGGAVGNGTASECTLVGWAGTTCNTGEAWRRPTSAISCRTVFGTGRGAGGDGPDLTGGQKLRAAASTYQPGEQTAMFPAESEAERERKAGGQRWVARG